MKVLLVNTFDRGGAAQACIRLHLALLREGISSKLLLLDKSDFTIPETYQFQHKLQHTSYIHNLTNKIKSKLGFGQNKKSYWYSAQDEEIEKLRAEALEYFSYPKTKFDITTSSLFQEADVVNLHWVANYIDWQTFFAKNNKPLVWTLHDENPFLGGEHYKEKIVGLDKFNNVELRKVDEAELKYEKSIIEYKIKALQKIKNSLYLVLSLKLDFTTISFK